MRLILQSLPALVFALVMLCWFVFAGVFFFRKKPAVVPERKRARASIPGVVLQGVAYLIVWCIHRPLFSPLTSFSQPVEIVIAVGTVAVACLSVGIVMAAVRTLGKEWSITARTLEGHQLATQGPYRFVRHPIYTGMLGMLLATGLAYTYWSSLLTAIVVFFVGTIIRVRSEERLLREQFGREFEVYADRVPAMLPGVY